MIEFNSENFPENLGMVLNELNNISKEVHDLAIGLVIDGELKSLTNMALGESYPYDYELYMNESIDPNVQALSSLLYKVDETIKTLIGLNQNSSEKPLI